VDWNSIDFVVIACSQQEWQEVAAVANPKLHLMMQNWSFFAFAKPKLHQCPCPSFPPPSPKFIFNSSWMLLWLYNMVALSIP
jgi:hypothetical protein